uniref:Uncharacterized protein n=1 Tax=Zea mays TaxID=4577 RepID=C4J794_MAIZE|nr:unknown [Zea mays]ACR37165.1 unknown [Zea mays]
MKPREATTATKYPLELCTGRPIGQMSFSIQVGRQLCPI